VCAARSGAGPHAISEEHRRMRAWMIGLACALLFGGTGLAPANAEEATAPADEAAEKEASAPEAEPAAESESAPEAAAEAAPEEEATAEEAEDGAFAGYGKHVANTFLAGVNGIITWPADPVMLAMKPTDEMRALPGGVVTGPVTGFFAGTLQGVFRLFTGSLDVALAPFTFFPMFSIEPRYQVIPGWEHGG
jgi:hypothetical protein